MKFYSYIYFNLYILFRKTPSKSGANDSATMSISAALLLLFLPALLVLIKMIKIIGMSSNASWFWLCLTGMYLSVSYFLPQHLSKKVNLRKLLREDFDRSSSQKRINLIVTLGIMGIAFLTPLLFLYLSYLGLKG